MKLAEYIRDTRGELKHVSWPTKKQAISYTAITVGLSLLAALYLGLLDALLAEGVKLLVS